MNNKPKLILGTAEFGHPNYAPFPEKKEVIKILNMAWEAGIEDLDTSDTYNTEYLSSYFKGFKQLFKSRKDPYAFYHYQPLEKRVRMVEKASVYEYEQLYGLKEAIVPMSINNTLFIDKKVDECKQIYARSVFDNGKLLLEGYTIGDCLSFVKRQSVTGVIIGVRSLQELQDILNVY